MFYKSKSRRSRQRASGTICRRMVENFYCGVMSSMALGFMGGCKRVAESKKFPELMDIIKSRGRVSRNSVRNVSTAERMSIGAQTGS